MSMQPEAGNDVWGTLGRVAGEYLQYKKETKMAELQRGVWRPGSTQAMAAPSGTPSATVYNPLPWLWQSANPQAEAKGVAGGVPASSAGAGMSAWLFIGAVLAIVFLLLLRR